LQETGLDPETIPAVIQFNKRDLPNIRPDAQLEELRQRSPEPLYGAVATRGEGVRETLEGLLELMFADLNRRYDFESKFNIVGHEMIRRILQRDTPAAPVSPGVTW